MRRSNRSSDLALGDRGSASLEFIVAGGVLLVPLVYLIVALGTIQTHALGAQAAARHIARSIATANDVPTAEGRADAIVRAIAAEYGMSPGSMDVALDCLDPGTCPAPGTTIVVTVSVDATLPLIPPVLGLQDIARVPIETRAVQRMSLLWGAS